VEDKIKYEKHWLKLLVEGDEKAYKRLFELYYSSLVMFAAKYLRDTDLAEDLVQDVIYDFWKQRQHLSELSSLKSWLYISVRNRCINYLEHDKVKKKYLQLNGEAEADFFLSQIIEEEVYLALKQAIDILPPKIRTIFYLILERKTNAEIASLLGITEEAVKAYRKRGMKMLRIRLSNFWILALLIF
jgi:RNA polymerase sigma-70 factor (ECF subfamily)